MKKIIKELPAILLVFGALLRITGTGAAALWFDESNTLVRTNIPFMSLFSESSENSGDLLLEIVLRPLMSLGHSLWLLRLPSLLAGLVSLWLVWKLMQRLSFSPSQQTITAALVAFLPGLLWIAQDARSYGILSCLFLAAIWFALESNLIGLLVMCGLTIYAHNTGPVLAAAAFIISAYIYPWKIKHIILVGIITMMAWIPGIYRMLNHWIIQQPWAPILTLPWFLTSTIQAIWPELWGGGFFIAALGTLLFTPFLLLSRSNVRARGRLIPLMAWTIPLGMLILFSIISKGNIILYRTLMPLLFPFSIWLGWELGTNGFINRLLLGVWVVMLMAGLIIWDPASRGGGLDVIAEDIRSQWKPGDSLLYTTITVGYPFNYYLGDLPHRWDSTVKDPFFLTTPSLVHPWLDTPNGEVSRSWVVIPQEPILITPEEWEALDDRTHHQDPIYKIFYLQAAPVFIYLVEE